MANRSFHLEEEAGIPIGVSASVLCMKLSGGRVMFTTLALVAALAAFLHAPMVEARAYVFCTSERPCGCPYNVSFCIPSCHKDARIDCGPTHKFVLTRDH